MKLFLWLSGMALLLLCFTGCGDVYRPTIIPNPPTFPDPRAAHTVLSVNANPSDSAGTQINPASVTVVDVSGDSVVSIANVGVNPVHAVQQTASQVLVVNQATASSGADSLSKVSFFGTTIGGTPAVITLPVGSAPNFVATTESNQAYVLLPNYAPPSVGVVSTLSNSLIATAPVGTNPVAMVETLDKNKLYVANQGDGTISAFNTVDRSARKICDPTKTVCPPPLSAPPIWLSARSDSQQVYVLESTGTLALLDTSTTAGPDVLTETAISVPGAIDMTYDGHLNRLYIAGQTTAVVVDVSSSTPQALATINLTAVQPSARGSQDPCAATAVNTLNAIGVTALPDGSRAYIGAYYRDLASGNICPQITVLNTTSNTVKTTIAVPGFANFDAICAATRFRFAMAAAGDSSRAYLSACDGGNINIINTLNDTYVLNQQAPSSARPVVPPNTQPPAQNPVFLIAGP